MNKTEEFLNSINDDIEWLTTEGEDEIECISVENLTEHLRKFFNE